MGKWPDEQPEARTNSASGSDVRVLSQRAPNTANEQLYGTCITQGLLFVRRARQLGATVMINGFKDLEGTAPGSDKPVCQTILQRAYKYSDHVSFALAVFPMVGDGSFSVVCKSKPFRWAIMPSCLIVELDASHWPHTACPAALALYIFHSYAWYCPQAPDKYTLDSWTYKDFHGKHVPASKDSIARWRRGLQACFKYAIDFGFKQLHILGKISGSS